MDQENHDNTRMRLRILLDAFHTTMLPTSVVMQGAYLATLPEGGIPSGKGLDVRQAVERDQPCQMCLLGAMALKQITKMSPFVLRDMSFSVAWEAESLREHFDDETLAVAEALFEGRPMKVVFSEFWKDNLESWNRVRYLAHALPRLDPPAHMAQVILTHMIENKGRVNLELLETKGYEFRVQGLTDKALLVLKEYDVLPEAVLGHR